MTAERFVRRLAALQAAEGSASDGGTEGDAARESAFLQVGMGQIFALSTEFVDLPIAEIERLLEHPVQRVRVGAVSIMNKAARAKRTPEERRRALYELYLRRHDRIDTWDLVDLGAPFVIGGYLLAFAKPRTVLYDLARSGIVWERRTAITATDPFIRRGELDDTFALAELLVDDPEDAINKPVGSWLRAAGAKDRPRLLAFLDRHAATMPRVTLRFAIEHLEPEVRAAYMERKALERAAPD